MHPSHARSVAAVRGSGGGSCGDRLGDDDDDGMGLGDAL